MSFNLKEKQARIVIEAKVKAIEQRLEDSFKDYSTFSETTEVNLGKDRLEKNPDYTLELGLEKSRVGTKHAVTEKKLDTEKSLFSDYRQNTSGDIPKLEEKRLANKPVEKEKYEKANSK